MNKISPIILFTYNRPIHTQRTVEALLKNQYAVESDLIIYSDAPKDKKSHQGVMNTRQYIHSVTGFKSVRIIEREKNFGLADNIIDGVTSIVKEYGRIIVMEDDMITSPYFLKYMNEALQIYENEESVISIHGYTPSIKNNLPETFFIKGADCWGWATWKRGWELFVSDGIALLNELKRTKRINEFDFEGAYPYTKMLKKHIRGEVNSWAIRWYASAFLRNKLTLYPGRSLVFNIGEDGSGTHCSDDQALNVKLSTTPINVSKIEIKESKKGRKAFVHYFRYTRIKRIIISRLKKLFSK